MDPISIFESLLNRNKIELNSETYDYWWRKAAHLRQRQTKTVVIEPRCACANSGQARIDR